MHCYSDNKRNSEDHCTVNVFSDHEKHAQYEVHRYRWLKYGMHVLWNETNDVHLDSVSSYLLIEINNYKNRWEDNLFIFGIFLMLLVSSGNHTVREMQIRFNCHHTALISRITSTWHGECTKKNSRHIDMKFLLCAMCALYCVWVFLIRFSLRHF